MGKSFEITFQSLLVVFIVAGLSNCEFCLGKDEPSAQVNKSNQLLQTTEVLPYKYWGNSYSLKFHRPSCPFARVMNPKHRQLFHFRWQAVASGEEPCHYCLPPFWLSTRACLMPHQSEDRTGQTQPLSPGHN